MAEDWQDKKVEVEYDGRQAGTVACELRRQRSFGFAPRLKAELRCRLDFTGQPAEVPRPTRASSFTLYSGGALLGQKDGWRVKDLEVESDSGSERIYLLLETK